MHGGDRSRSRRTPLVWAGGLTGLLLAGAFFPVAVLRDAETWAAVPNARLRLSPAFLALAPVNNTLDALSLLSVREHVGLWILGVSVYLAWRMSHATRPRPRVGGWRHEVGLAAGALSALFAVYAFGALVPRPMAALALVGPDSSLVTIDVHSHTSASMNWWTPSSAGIHASAMNSRRRPIWRTASTPIAHISKPPPMSA